jgi:hypothetical protein
LILPGAGLNPEGGLTSKPRVAKLGNPGIATESKFNAERVGQSEPKYRDFWCNPLRVGWVGCILTQGDAALALGCVVIPLRGKELTPGAI